MKDELLSLIEARAAKWSQENGLKGPFSVTVRIEDWGFKCELTGPYGSAYCTFQRDGSPSLWEKTSR